MYLYHMKLVKLMNGNVECRGMSKCVTRGDLRKTIISSHQYGKYSLELIQNNILVYKYAILWTYKMCDE